MSEEKIISPLLDGLVLGSPMNCRGGIRCCPAIREATDEKYIVKIISVPSSQVQLDALLLTGAYRTSSDAEVYFRELAEDIEKEAENLNELSRLEGFLPFEGSQIVPMEDGKLGYDIYLLSRYRRSLQKYMQRNPVTHLEAVNLGLDLCAALSICRRAGYIYVDLKPANIFLTRNKEFRIGDLGFIKLDSLNYLSLPEKYRSPYTPAELQNELNVLNKTVDTYAVGMILYQIYNEGALPSIPEEPGAPFPCPANADYEISAIIMKAIDRDPANRWDDPMVMGQALVKYMQRNTINNVPITPPAGILSATGISSAKDTAAQTGEEDSAEAIAEEAVPGERAEDSDSSEDAPEAAEIPPENDPDPKAPDAPEAEEAPSATEESIPSDGEDDLAALLAEDADDLDFSIAFDSPPETGDQAEEPKYPEPKPVPIKKQRLTTQQIRFRQIRNLIMVLLLLSAIGAGLFWMYRNYYLQTIDVLTVDGTQSELTVRVETKLEESKLKISCTDTYGNCVVKNVENGQVVFYDLLPDSLYRIEVSTDGFHRLSGATSEIFTTDSVTNVVSLSAITGAADGSVLLNFTIDGPEPEAWTVTCCAEDEEPIIESFTGHTHTVRNLTVGKHYTITLATDDGTQIAGETTLEFTATRLIRAENLQIVSCVDGILTVRWDQPEDVTVEKWKVRCYSDNGHEEILEISGTEISFTGIETSREYTVEVTASGMTEPSRVTLTPNPVTVTGYSVDTSDPMRLTVSWSFEGTAPAGGWLLLYSLDGLTDQQSVVKATETTATIEPHIPGTTYHFTLQAADSTFVFGSTHSITTEEAESFNRHDLPARLVTAHLLKTPETEGWTAETISQDLYTDTFRPGDSISVVLKTTDAFNLPKDVVVPVLYVIRDADGNAISRYISEENVIWEDLWYPDNYHNCELTLPKVPVEPGSYTLEIYFDYCAMATAAFTIAE